MRLNKSIPFAVALSLSYLTTSLQAEENPASAPSNPAAQDHVVNVAKSGLTFDPPNVKAKKGDTVTFVFFQDGHSVTQTSFTNPCAGTKPASASICQPPPSSISTDVPSPAVTSPGSAYPTGDGAIVSATTSKDTPGSPEPSPQPSLPSIETPPPASPPSNYPGDTPPAPVVSASAPPPNDSSPFPVDGAGPTPPTPVTENPPAPANCTQPTSPPPSEPAPAPSPSPTPAPSDAGIVSSVSSGGGGEMTPDMGMGAGGSSSCDSKCIEVTGSCQMSADCNLQKQSPPTTQCKVEDGVCKKCGQKTEETPASTSPEGEQPPSQPDAPGSNPYPSKDGSVSHWRQKRMIHSYVLSRRQEEASEQLAVDPNADSESGTSSSEVPTDQGTTSANSTNPSQAPQDGPGLDSGLVKVDEASKASGLRWTITVTDDSKPLWFMSAGQNDCTSGMVFAVNPPDSGNTYEKFASVAKTSTCSSTYPACTTLTGDGATAANPPPKCAASAQPPTPNPTPEPSSPSNVTGAEPTPNPSSPGSSNSTTPPTDVSATGSNPPTGETPQSPSNYPSSPDSSNKTTPPTDVAATGSSPPAGDTPQPSPNVTETPSNGNINTEPSANGTTTGNSAASPPVQVSFSLHASLLLVLVSLITLV